MSDDIQFTAAQRAAADCRCAPARRHLPGPRRARSEPGGLRARSGGSLACVPRPDYALALAQSILYKPATPDIYA